MAAMTRKLIEKKTFECLNGKEFRRQRLAANKTQRDISLVSGLSQGFICFVESGEVKAKGKTAWALVKALGKV